MPYSDNLLRKSINNLYGLKCRYALIFDLLMCYSMMMFKHIIYLKNDGSQNKIIHTLLKI